MAVVLIVLTVLPLGSAAVSLLGRQRITELVTVVVGVICFGLCVWLVPTVSRHPLSIAFLRTDAVSVIFLLGTTYLYAATAVYCLGYLRRAPAKSRVWACRGVTRG